MFISIHIPETVGEEVGYYLEHGCQRRVLWDYDPSYSYVQEIQPDIRQNIKFVKSFFSVIHGDFYYSKYAGVLPDAKFVASIRHPVDRVVAQYYRLAASGQDGDWRAKHVRSGEMNVVEFAHVDKNTSSAMTRYLLGRQTRDYDHLFLAESLSDSIMVFAKKFGYNSSADLSKAVKNQEKDKVQMRRNGKFKMVTKEEEGQLFGLCGEDVALYIEASELFAAEARKYL